ncbi:hypothetical protein [uncultured Brachyspira sp.]|uniref:hypothetical protein n=1 Tax=uncultured Brachyspira sp. TaxID=221953 RepID=UPI0026312C93|nr:hypothetical protein [uncultured Brachyspira sp.]
MAVCPYCGGKGGGLCSANTNIQANILKKDMNAFTSVMESIINGARIADNIFLEIQTEISQALNDYVTNPLLAIMSINRVLKRPAELAVNITNKVLGYSSFIETIINNNAYTYSQKALKETMISFAAMDMCISVTNGDFKDKSESLYTEKLLLETEKKILTSFENIEGKIEGTYEDQYHNGIEYNINIEAKKELIKMFDITRTYLIENINNLPTKRTLILNKDRNYIDVCYEVYGNVEEETLNRLIEDNNIKGEEIFMLRKGRSINYYID